MTNTADDKLLSREFVLLWIARFSIALVFSGFTATIASYCFQVYQCNEAVAGFAVGIYIIFGLLSRFFAGRYVDVVGRKNMLAVSVCVFFVCTALYLIVLPFWAFIVIRAIQGFAFGFFSNTSNVISVGILPKQRIGEGLGYFALSGTVASALGPFICLALFQGISFTAMFIFAACAAGVGALCSILLHVAPVVLSAEERERLTKTYHLSDTFEKTAIGVAVISACLCLIYNSTTSFLATYAETLNAAQLASWFFIVSAIIQLITRPTMGRLFDSKGPDAAIYPALAGVVLGFVILALSAFNSWLILVAALPLSFGFGTAVGSLQTLAVMNLPSNRVGLATATYFLFVDTGTGVGPMLFGALVVPLGGYTNLFAVEVALAVVFLMLYFLLRRHDAAQAK